MSEETQVNVVEEENPSAAEKETKALKKMGADIGDESITKVDLREPKEDTTEETPVIEETAKESTKEEPIIEEIKEEPTKEKPKAEEKIPEPIKEQVQPEINIPEGIPELVNFINETGGSMDDYVKLNKNYSELNDDNLLREFYNTTKSHLSSDEINFIIEDKFSYDDDMDDPTDIKRKKLAYKEELAKAKNHLEGQKEKYYKEVRTTDNLSAEQQKAVDFFNRHNIEQESFAQSKESAEKNFKQKTNEVFDQEFKGFDFNIDDKKFRFKVNDATKVKDTQSDLMNVIGGYLDENNYLTDGYGYHKALFAAQNADKIANHFYQLGKTEAIKEVSSESKNINMDPRQTSTGYVEAGGIKVRAISGDDSSKLRIKLRDKK
ncbi:MAG: hypothetical protein HN905_03240 [Candidatus Marinimicrobia bacterium]|jgi:hypothetical protein|nr:hypothetical protein [Candidatus Neomarinimicrobiota bacterium]